MRVARCITAFCFAAACVAVLPLHAQSPELNKPVAQLIFEGGSGDMTSQPAGSAAGVAFHFEDSLPTFGRLVINEENLWDRGVYRSGEDSVKLQGARWAGLNWG